MDVALHGERCLARRAWGLSGEITQKSLEASPIMFVLEELLKIWRNPFIC